jgi:hypothetical protein
VTGMVLGIFFIRNIEKKWEDFVELKLDPFEIF